LAGNKKWEFKNGGKTLNSKTVEIDSAEEGCKTFVWLFVLLYNLLNISYKSDGLSFALLSRFLPTHKYLTRNKRKLTFYTFGGLFG
jgi:hypothetical protein